MTELWPCRHMPFWPRQVQATFGQREDRHCARMSSFTYAPRSPPQASAQPLSALKPSTLPFRPAAGVLVPQLACPSYYVKGPHLHAQGKGRCYMKPFKGVEGTADLDVMVLGADSPADQKWHLLLLINGLFGAPANWDVVSDNLLLQSELSHMAILAATSNSRIQVAFQVLFLRAGERNLWINI